jgi:hypothetical protein
MSSILENVTSIPLPHHAIDKPVFLHTSGELFRTRVSQCSVHCRMGAFAIGDPDADVMVSAALAHHANLKFNLSVLNQTPVRMACPHEVSPNANHPGLCHRAIEFISPSKLLFQR